MKIDEDEKNKIMATKPPSLTMKVLRPLAHLLAEYTDPSQISSIAKQFGFEKNAKTPDEACGAILEMFDSLSEEKNEGEIKEIIEALLALYAHLIDEKLHEEGLIGSARKILYIGHFQLAFHIHKKEYILVPLEGPAHGITMRMEGTTKSDFQDIKKRKMRMANCYITKDVEDFRYNGNLLDKIGKGTDYYKVFDALYTLLPNGGFGTYTDIGTEVKKRIPKTKSFSSQKMAKFIQDNLSTHNGFLHHTKIKNTLIGGKKLIHTVRKNKDEEGGFEFNNHKGS